MLGRPSLPVLLPVGWGFSCQPGNATVPPLNMAACHVEERRIEAAFVRRMFTVQVNTQDFGLTEKLLLLFLFSGQLTKLRCETNLHKHHVIPLSLVTKQRCTRWVCGQGHCRTDSHRFQMIAAVVPRILCPFGQRQEVGVVCAGEARLDATHLGNLSR